MRLYHFSEEPGITSFEPRRAPTSNVDEDVVWAIDDLHQVMYFFPRDCPRACFWPGPQTTDADRESFFGAVDARMVIAIESAWLERVRSTTLYRYSMPVRSFSPARDDDSGHWVSHEAVRPLTVEPLPDLLAALIAENIELRITPSLVELWKRVITSTLEFSGTRLRNAQGWDHVDWSALELGPAATR